MSGVMELVYAFVETARSLHKDFVEAWLKGKVNDYDMDMVLIDERHARERTYKKLANEIQNERNEN